MQINILEAKNQLSQLIKAVQAGEDVIIANRGKPVARLVSIDQEAAAVPKGSARGILDWLDKHPLPEQARRSAAAIEAAIQEEREAWD
jgi:prevent-host-death family protein